MSALEPHKSIRDDRPSYLKRVKIRFVFIICLLAADLVFAPLLKVGFTLPTVLILFSIAILGSLVSLIWTMWGRWLDGSVYFVTFVDLFLITVGLHYLGGIESTFSWIYVVVLIAIALLHGMKISIYFAIISSLMYTALLFAEFRGMIPHIDFNVVNPRFLYDDPFYLHDKLVSTYILFFMTAGVTGYLSQKLRRSQNELEHKVAERTEDLRKSEKSYRLLAENVTDIIWTSDLNLRFTYYSPSITRVGGYSVEEAMSLGIEEILTPASLELARKVLSEELAIENDKQKDPSRSRTLDLEHYRKDGSTMWAEVKVTFLRDQDGRPISVLGISRDVTEQINLQQQLLQAQKMESIGTLAGGIAHDFNNLLGGILGYASFMKSKMTKEHPFFNYVDTIERSSMRAAELTSQLLAFARGGKYVVKPVDLNKVVDETISIFARTFDKSIEIKTHLCSQLPTVEGDASQFQQVLMNLCVNAADAMPAGGRLTIETYVETLTQEYARMHSGIEAGPYVILAVTDTGAGIDKETVKRIFEPFFTTKEKGKGTGLGLSMVYGVVKNHKGFVNVYSELGYGSTFKICFPASDKPEAAGPLPEEVEAQHGGNELILVVDDEEPIRNLAREILESNGYRVLLAENGEEAVEVYGKCNGDVDLVILDMIMPKLGGHETFLRLKKHNPAVKALLSTGYSQNGKAQDILDSGVSGFLQKPYQANALLSSVRGVLDAETAPKNHPESVFSS